VGLKNIFSFVKNHTYPIGVDMGKDALEMVQLGHNGKGLYVVAGGSRNRPRDLKAGSSDWQRWCIEEIKNMTREKKCRGKQIIAAAPAKEVFIEHIKVKPTDMDNLDKVVFEKVEDKLPFEANQAVIKSIPAEDDNVLVIATQREKINRYLAIYEKTNLQIKSIGVWPIALTNTYVNFFGRRKSDVASIVMLLDIESSYTNLVICRHRNLLFARTIPIGGNGLKFKEKLSRLVLELNGCKRQFNLLYKDALIDRLIFLLRGELGKQACISIAKQLKIPAQIGDCLAAVEIPDPSGSGIDRRESSINWSTSFGLSLS